MDRHSGSNTYLNPLSGERAITRYGPEHMYNL